MDMKIALFVSISVISLIILFTTCKKMKPGIGPHNLKVIGLLSIAIFTAILGLANDSSTQAAFGIFGAIAGYLFGTSSGNESRIDSNGDNNQIAGRDINNRIEKMVNEIKQKMQNDERKSYHVHAIYKDIRQSMASKRTEVMIQEIIQKYLLEGYSLTTITSDLNGTDALLIIFEIKNGQNIVSSSRD